MSASPSVRRIPRALFILAIVGIVPTVATACSKKPDPVIIDAGPPPAPVETATQLVAMEEDAGAQADADAEAGPVFRGPAVNPNVARVKACCTALANQGKSQANTPEGAMVMSAAAQCSAAAAHLAPNGTAPELATMRQLLAGKQIPPICQGL